MLTRQRHDGKRCFDRIGRKRPASVKLGE